MFKCAFCDIGIMEETFPEMMLPEHYHMECDNPLCESNKHSIGMWANREAYVELEKWEHG